MDQFFIQRQSDLNEISLSILEKSSELSLGCDRPQEVKKLHSKENQVILENLEPLKRNKNLRYLQLDYFQLKGQVFSDLSTFASLERLALDSCSLTKWNWISDLLNLKDLSIISSRFIDISPIKNLRQLKKLNLYQNGITNLDPIETLIEIEELSIAWNKILDISPLSSLLNLESLKLNGNNKLQSLAPLEGLKKLKRLSVDILKKEKNRFARIRPDIEISGQFFTS
ncbi:hypothetical protein QMM87_01125 [Leptospira santarosai]|uniref:leucine-rich repeat domain-containing protein n=1 Tax=Leptospira santarosai TaxID=28183 RepID=UPI0024AF05B3|nr:leucine-rich repeat domain-containing protein [Leptospira santarosai]MDI7227281.1 hypothetical protein [Leptospira santarosai]